MDSHTSRVQNCLKSLAEKGVGANQPLLTHRDLSLVARSVFMNSFTCRTRAGAV